MDGRRILIFCETKKGCDAVTRQLRMDGWPALSIHGDKSQHERDWVLAEFKSGKHPIMIATDVAARGLGKPPLSLLLSAVPAVWFCCAAGARPGCSAACCLRPAVSGSLASARPLPAVCACAAASASLGSALAALRPWLAVCCAWLRATRLRWQAELLVAGT